MSYKIDIDHGSDEMRDIYSSEVRVNGEIIVEVFEKGGRYYVNVEGIKGTTYTLDYEDFKKSILAAREAVQLTNE